MPLIEQFSPVDTIALCTNKFKFPITCLSCEGTIQVRDGEVKLHVRQMLSLDGLSSPHACELSRRPDKLDTRINPK